VYNDEVWMMIREMKEKRMSVTAIAEHLGIDRKTVRKYMKSDKVPRPSHSKRKSKLDPVRPIVKELIDKYDLSAVRILEEIRKWGYKGSYTTLKEYCRTLRKERAIKAVYCFQSPVIPVQPCISFYKGIASVKSPSDKIFMYSHCREIVFTDKLLYRREEWLYLGAPLPCICVFRDVITLKVFSGGLSVYSKSP